MPGEFKPVPVGASDLASYQLFTETCRQGQQSLAPGSVWDPSKAQVFNRADGDGHFEVLYQDPASDYRCAGQWLWPNQELLIRGGRLSQKSTQPLAGTRIPDACRATELLTGPEEFGGAVCREGEDPLIQKVQDHESVRKFSEYCSKSLQSWGNSRFGTPLGNVFDLKHSRVENSMPGDGFYSLIYESRANQFICEGFVDAGARTMTLRYGSPKQFEQGGSEDGLFFSMLDACLLTTDLYGQDEIGVCKDQSARDRSVQEYVGFGVQAFLGLTSTYATYRLGRRLWRTTWAPPLLRSVATGMMAGEAYDTVAGMFVEEDHALRRYGTPVVTLTGIAAPTILARTAIGQRIAASTFGVRAAPWASRLGWGLAAVAVVNWIAKKIMDNSDYEASVNSRVTDRVYREDGLYDYSFWKCVNPLSWLNKSRRVFRAIAPDMMEGAVTWDNEDVEAKIKAEDQQQVVEAEEFLRQTLPAFLHSDNWEDVNEALVLLRDQVIKLSEEEENWGKVMVKEGYAEMRSEFPNMTDEQAESFCRKFLMKQVQDAAAFMVFVPGANSDWARELFNKDGTLKAEPDAEGTLPYQRLQRRWAKPESEKSTKTSEAYDFVPPGDAMA